jgi:adenine-specific DNA-methyltransferase
MSTAFHAAYWAHRLRESGPRESGESVARAVSNARVDVNPHQVDAAVFALRSPLTNGVLLADEVGLGKTIEAGLLIAQSWAERRRRIIVLVPASLRTQWADELTRKFMLPTEIIEGTGWRKAVKAGEVNPFDASERVLICSYHFAAGKAAELASFPWHLVVMDEAHRLRNVYQSNSKVATALLGAIRERRKLLLTATPLQNRLEELFGLMSFVDEHVFGDLATFKAQFCGRDANTIATHEELRRRLEPVCRRALRRQVSAYVRFTARIPLTFDFVPAEAEQRLYDEVSEYLRREELAALPTGQRALMTLILRKLLASSTFAIVPTLQKLADRIAAADPPSLDDDTWESLRADFQTLGEMEDEWDEGGESGDAARRARPTSAQLADEERRFLLRLAALGAEIRINAKGEALKAALGAALEKAVGLGAARKAVIFTESVRTQRYLFDLLTAAGYGGEIVCLSGNQSDSGSKRILEAWRTRHKGEDVVTGRAAVDLKTALVEEFRERGTLLLATEAAAEGVNLQFCAMVVNYDLPWNPQRVEQRIGRCHRYGQRHDVVVVNFLNRANRADERVFELLAQKFQLFEGVFGASDQVLGALASGLDIERRIAEIYQTCRLPDEITRAFDAMQADLEDEIADQMAATRRAVLEHFDEEVAESLRFRDEDTRTRLSERQKWLLGLTRHGLGAAARFLGDDTRFEYPADAPEAQRYDLDWKRAEGAGETFWHDSHPLAERLLDAAAAGAPAFGTLCFDYAAYGRRVSAVEGLRGRGGYLRAVRVQVDSLDERAFVLVAGVTDDGETLSLEVCQKLFDLPARLVQSGSPDSAAIEAATESALASEVTGAVSALVRQLDSENERFYEAECDKLDRWADDRKAALELRVKELDLAIREADRRKRATRVLSEKIAADQEKSRLTRQRNTARKDLYEAQDKVEQDRERLLESIQARLSSTTRTEHLFTVAWRMDAP